MNSPTLVAIIVAVITVAAIAVMAIRTVSTSRHLKSRYGDEYHRAIAEHGGRAAAEAELRGRIRAHDDLTLTDLSEEQVEQYRSAWTSLQAQFVDDPTSAVRAADQLVGKLVSDRGYPAVEFDERVRQLSVEHSGILEAYREAHTAAERSNAGWASTEDLRRALVSYREVIAHVLGDPTLDTAPADPQTDAPDDGAADVPTDAATAVAAGVADADEAASVEGGVSDNDSANDATDEPSTIPTVNGAPPTPADLSANEGYVTASSRPDSK